jgi:hypothetical protein
VYLLRRVFPLSKKYTLFPFLGQITQKKLRYPAGLRLPWAKRRGQCVLFKAFAGGCAKAPSLELFVHDDL